MRGGMRELALFAGAGGGILGGVLLGWRTICAVEIDAYCARRLMQRQNEGHLPPFPVWDDVCSFDGRPWRGAVDVVSGGFPCQDISVANTTGAGIDGERSGLWREFTRIVREVRPRYVLVENSPNLTTRGLGRVLGDLAEMGADGRWGVLSAEDFGAWHLRQRIWIIADFDRERIRQQSGRRGGESVAGERILTDDGPSRTLADAAGEGLEGGDEPPSSRDTFGELATGGWWDVEPGLVRVVHGVANRVDRIRALGNGQVPAVAAGAWRTLARIGKE